MKYPIAQFLGMTALTFFICSGCAHYQLGSNVPAEYRKIAVPTFSNTTDYPQLGGIATSSLLKNMINDGTFIVTKYDSASVYVIGEITGCGGTAISYDRNRHLVSSEYRMTLTAKVSVIEAKTGTKLLDSQTFTGSTTYMTRGDNFTGMQSAYPNAAEDLANNILDALKTIKAPKK